MKLIDVVKDIKKFDDEFTIYAKEPWTTESPAAVEYEPDEGQPDAVKNNNMTYFLEVDLSIEFLEGWTQHLKKEPTLQEKCQRLIDYAINDS